MIFNVEVISFVDGKNMNFVDVKDWERKKKGRRRMSLYEAIADYESLNWTIVMEIGHTTLQFLDFVKMVCCCGYVLM
jgi:hypothetical protein